METFRPPQGILSSLVFANFPGVAVSKRDALQKRNRKGQISNAIGSYATAGAFAMI